MVSVMNFVVFILFEIILLELAEGGFQIYRNNTDRESKWRTGRLKRSLHGRMPEKLEIRIEDPPKRYIDVSLTKTDQFLANEHLPVIISGADSIEVMQGLGEFVMYQDTATCSAIVYFKKSKALYGIVGMNYHIQHLRLEFDDDGTYRLGNIAEPEVQRRQHPSNHIHPDSIFPPPSDTDAWENLFTITSYQLNQNLKRKANCHDGPSSKHQHIDHEVTGGHHEADTTTGRRSSYEKMTPKNVKFYHLEILIFVTRDITEIFKNHFGREHYIQGMVRYYITYFNAVDMIFQKLQSKTLSLTINIAKIVIETDTRLFNFMSDDDCQFSGIVQKLPQYLAAHQYEFPPDSFDHVFVHTRRTVVDDSVPIDGLSKYGDDLYEARKNNRFYSVVPITVVKYQHVFADFGIATHEIGRILNMKLNSKVNGLTLAGQCHSVMQRQGPKCIDCLRWSDESIKQYKEFFSTNRNRCFLLNQPRSLRPPGRSSFVTPHRQCLCFGYDSYIKYRDNKAARRILINACNRRLQCQIVDGTQIRMENTVKPFDGTPCAHQKVCWQGSCENVDVFVSA